MARQAGYPSAQFDLARDLATATITATATATSRPTAPATASATSTATATATATATPTATATNTIVNTYDTGSGTETVPNDVTQLVVEIWYPGGGGSRTTGNTNQRGGGSGAYSIKTVTLTPVNWGQTLSYNCGTAGLGRTGSTGNGGAASGGSITDNLSGVTIAFSPGTPAQGGVNSGSGVGGTRWTTNTTEPVAGRRCPGPRRPRPRRTV